MYTKNKIAENRETLITSVQLSTTLSIPRVKIQKSYDFFLPIENDDEEFSVKF